GSARRSRRTRPRPGGSSPSGGSATATSRSSNEQAMIGQIIFGTAGLGLLIAVLGLAVLWVLRGRSIGVMLAVVAVITVAATLAGVVVIILAMAIEAHSTDI